MEMHLLALVIWVLIIIVCYSYIMYRNIKVYRFRIKINHQSNDVVLSFLRSIKDDDEFQRRFNQYLEIEEKADMIVHKHPYEDMLYSFKPLKLEYWFTKEEIEFMNLKYKPIR